MYQNDREVGEFWWPWKRRDGSGIIDLEFLPYSTVQGMPRMLNRWRTNLLDGLDQYPTVVRLRRPKNMAMGSPWWRDESDIN